MRSWKKRKPLQQINPSHNTLFTHPFLNEIKTKLIKAFNKSALTGDVVSDRRTVLVQWQRGGGGGGGDAEAPPLAPPPHRSVPFSVQYLTSFQLWLWLWPSDDRYDPWLSSDITLLPAAPVSVSPSCKSVWTLRNSTRRKEMFLAEGNVSAGCVYFSVLYCGYSNKFDFS